MASVTGSTGYGQATTISELPGSPPGKQTTAHRQAWIITNGAPRDHVAPSGRVITNRVRHRCPGGPNRLCCNPAHLAVGTDKDNTDDRAGDGNTFRGEQVTIAKLTKVAVIEALAAHAAGESVRALARRFGVSRATMSCAIHGDTWGHVSPEVRRPRRGAPAGRKLTAADVVKIRSDHASGRSAYSLAKEYEVGRTTIVKIINRETWKNVISEPISVKER